MRNESKIVVSKTDTKRSNAEDLDVDGRIIFKFILTYIYGKRFMHKRKEITRKVHIRSDEDATSTHAEVNSQSCYCAVRDCPVC